MHLELQELSVDDGRDVFEMLNRIGSNEYSFTNPVNGMSYFEFKEWLQQQNGWSHGIGLPEGYVCQTVFWLMGDGAPIGVGKIRHHLTDSLRRAGGSIGYAVDSSVRGRGYGTALLSLLIGQARRMGVDDLLITAEKRNIASIRAIKKNGGVLAREDDRRFFFEIGRSQSFKVNLQNAF